MTKYLIIETKYFIDPHGSPDEAGIVKTITTGAGADRFYQSWISNKNKWYQYDEWVDEDELKPSEDGYNAECSQFKIRIILDHELEKIQQIIKDYNKLK